MDPVSAASLGPELLKAAGELRPKPVSERSGFDQVQPLVLASLSAVVSASADVVIQAQQAFDWRLVDAGSLDPMVAGLIDGHARLAGVVESGRPRVRALREVPLRALPALDPFTSYRLDSAVRWHDWLLGSLLDLAEAASHYAAGGRRAVATPENAEMVALLLQAGSILSMARKAHEQLQQAASASTMDAVSVDRRASERARRQVEADKQAKAETWSRAFEQRARVLEEVLRS